MCYLNRTSSLAIDTMNLRDVFALRLKHERGLSQEDLAYEAHINRSYPSQIDEGQFHVSLKVTGKLAEALRVEPAEFLKIARESIARALGDVSGA